MEKLKSLIKTVYQTQKDRYSGEITQIQGYYVVKIHHIRVTDGGEEQSHILHIELDKSKPLAYAHLEPDDLSKSPFRLIAPIDHEFLNLMIDSVKNLKELYDVITADMLIRVDR